jgi:hypothetical protein
MTGRAAGFCSGFGVPGYTNYVLGRAYRGWGGGRGGGGRGFRNWFCRAGLTGWQRAGGFIPGWGNPLVYGVPYYAPTTPVATGEQELTTLKAQAEYLENALDGIRRQLKDLETQRTAPQSG